MSTPNKRNGSVTKASDGTFQDDDFNAGIKAVRAGLSEKEFEEKFADQMKQPVNRNKTVGRLNRPTKRTDTMGATVKASTEIIEDCKLTRIVLKVFTLSNSSGTETPFFLVNGSVKIGSDKSNDICIETDQKMAPIAHATIEYADGNFFLNDGGFEYASSVKLIPNRLIWVLENGSRFSAGSSVFLSCGTNAEGSLLLETVGGPLKGEKRFVTKKGVTIGRHTDNGISLPADKELSRKHSKIVFDEGSGKYFVCDVGSTNGTYMQLVGPYGMKYKLNINDNILVGRTGFEVNRFETALSEEIGSRPSMEDSTADFQQLKISGLSHPSIAPLSFFGVYDGHGGAQASTFLSEHLHRNIVDRISIISKDVQAAAVSGVLSIQDELIVEALKDSFLKTDLQYLAAADNSEPGSTATTVLIAGDRIYCANLGDSRTVLCRNSVAYPLSDDHKPSRADETKRIKEAGGHIINNRVMGVLAVSRSFGDANLKKSVREMMKGDGDLHNQLDEGKKLDEPLVIAVPEIMVESITSQDQFLILACDGLFDVFSSEEVCSFVLTFMQTCRDSQKCVSALSDDAIKKRGAKDNVSIILIILNRWY